MLKLENIALALIGIGAVAFLVRAFRRRAVTGGCGTRCGCSHGDRGPTASP